MTFSDEQFESLLRESLRDVAEAEPRAGLVNRVLATATSSPENWWRALLRRWPVWAVATAAAVVMIVALVWSSRRESKSQVVHSNAPKVEAPAQSQQQQVAGGETPKTVAPHTKTAPKVLATRGHARRPSSRSLAMNRPLVSSPMTSQERALMALAQTAPQVLQQVAPQETPDGRLAPIPAIKIEPLPEADGGQQ